MLPRILLVSVVTSLSFSVPASADLVLISVDVSDPAAVSFSATDELLLISDSSARNTEGVTLVSFFTADSSLGDTTNPTPVTGSLIARDNTFNAYNYALNEYGFLTLTDMNLVHNSEENLQFFRAGEPAFLGISTINLSTASLPSPGASGDIKVGDTINGSGVVLGQWAVVPEPSAFLFGAVVSALVVVGVLVQRVSGHG
jgi:hypothetical protein